jgi:hypothetical protein
LGTVLDRKSVTEFAYEVKAFLILFRKSGRPARLVPIPEIIDVRVDWTLLINEEIFAGKSETMVYILLTVELTMLTRFLILSKDDESVEYTLEGRSDTTLAILLTVELTELTRLLIFSKDDESVEYTLEGRSDTSLAISVTFDKIVLTFPNMLETLFLISITLFHKLLELIQLVMLL